jgi:hypothetical protein
LHAAEVKSAPRVNSGQAEQSQLRVSELMTPRRPFVQVHGVGSDEVLPLVPPVALEPPVVPGEGMSSVAAWLPQAAANQSTNPAPTPDITVFTPPVWLGALGCQCATNDGVFWNAPVGA